MFLLQILLAAGAVQGALVSFLLVRQKKNQLANRLLAVLILAISAQSVLVGFDTRDFFLRFPHLSKVGWLLPTLFGPLIYLFTVKVSSEKPRFRPKDLLHFIPFFTYFLLLLPYYLKSAAEKRLYLTNFEKASLDDFGILNQVTNFIHITYAILALVHIHNHKKNILDNFSELKEKKLNWLQQLITFIFALLLFSVAVFYSKKFNIPFVEDAYHFHYLGVIVCIYWIGYKALSQPEIFNKEIIRQNKSVAPVTPVTAPEPAENAEPVKYEKSGIPDEQATGYAERLLLYMSTNKPYLNNDYTLQNLSNDTGIPKHHLSQVINDKLGKNFFTFINEYRVQAAQELLLNEQYKHYTILAVAMEAGFSSKATFNSVFKKITGITPSQFAAGQKVVV
ncbi:AraC family transcriptional regulator [Telluribacter sp. SYSU D00476]|uniref:helix-turn-helix domain-containing protein n=1 Tax=Telluribacter sp. SYSU D00476 TaxID=2811430 RepID=UPI001FF536C2|nr:helix-turn-helix domain-containing protein [Telluribacter sp. SYSU D00476]